MSTIVIHKQMLDPQHIMQISVPAGAQMLCAREQHNRPTVWYICDPSGPSETRTLVLLGTGQPKEDTALENCRYLGLCSLSDGDLIIHVFEQIKAN